MKKDVTTYSIFILLLFLSTNKVFASINIVDNFNSSSIELHLKDTGHKKVNNILDHPERLKIECDDQKMARACFAYATYLYVEPELYKQSYDYFVTAYNLGQKESGVYIANYQINHPEIFTNDIQLSIDESIYYAEQAFESGFPDATRLLMVIYTKPEFKRVDYKKAEYYSKIAIEQNVKFSRIYLASLYMYEMKNEAKIKESIKLYQDDLMIEKNWQSALALMTIHLYPEEYGATFEPDLVKTLAYAYVSSDLRDERNENGFNNVDTRFAAAMQKELPPETLKQAKALYLEMMSQMNDAHQ
ncbi:hypothetical protein [Psychrobacter celer]|uniref:hypothetical protein n=2 Tax=Psychrobacter celer TaxID=306572 RepID=UPI003FD396E8